MVAGEGEDVVPEEISFAIVLVKTAVSGAIDEIAFGHYATAAFIEINAPTAITKAGDVVPQIVADNRARLLAEGVDAAQVTQNGTVAIRFDAEVMNMVELDDVVACPSWAV